MAEWSGDTRPADPAPFEPRHWLVLATLGAAFLLVLLDGTIVYVALPAIQRDLDLTAGDVPWVMTAYLLCFGGLLMLGGRLSARVRPRHLLVFGLGLLTVGSLVCGLARTGGTMVVGRAMQGVAAAIAAPACLPLLATAFPRGGGRRRALRTWTAIGALAGTVGLLVGGPLTDHVGWRWVFLLNVPVALALMLASPLLPHIGPPAPFIRVGPLYSRTRMAGVVILATIGLAVDGACFLMTMYTQQLVHLSASRFAVTMTAMTLSAVVGSAVGQVAVLRSGLRAVALAGMAGVITGCLLLTGTPARIGDGQTLLALSILGAGVGAAFLVGQIAVVSSAPQAASMRLSGLSDASFSIGGGVGLLLLAGVLAREDDTSPGAGLFAGWPGGFAVAAGIAMLGAAATLALPRRPRDVTDDGSQAP